MAGFGHFEGDVVTKWREQPTQDRDMELLADFSFVDQDGKRWKACKGCVVNGASIPSALWTVVGPPFVGDYRRASVVHDVACEKRLARHQDVHLMFFRAMRADDVAWGKAAMMYLAVKRFGPKWSKNSGELKKKKHEPNAIRRYIDALKVAAEHVDESAGLKGVEEFADELLAGKTVHQVAESRVVRLPNKLGENRKSPAKHMAGKPPKAKSLGNKIEVARQSKGKVANNLSPNDVRAQTLRSAVGKLAIDSARLCEFRKDKVQCLLEVGARLVESSDADAALRAEIDFSPLIEAGQLSKRDRLKLIDQALILVGENYVHRPLKEAMYAINPVQRLRLLRERISRTSDSDLPSVLEFHGQLLKIFLSTRDLHTNYILPSPFGNQIAFLPFLVEDYFQDGDTTNRRFLVTRLFNGFSSPPFGVGTEITRWNGVPISRAVDINGDRFGGSNREARRARGIETLTVRSLIGSLPPEEDFVLVEYKTDDGDVHELRAEWMLFEPRQGADAREMPFEAAAAQGIDIEQSLVRVAKRILFAPEVNERMAQVAAMPVGAAAESLDSIMPEILEARTVDTPWGEFGCLRIRSFSVDDADRFVGEVLRLIELLPQHGLIVDVRGNGGGLILAGEQLLQLFTPRRIQPTLFQLRNTPLNRRLVDSNGFLAPWRDSTRQAVRTGATYSQGFPITDVRKANEIGQKYYGPVVLVTDGLCYSTTDILAAGFQDHEIGPILGTDNNTGAGGANVWDHRLLQSLLGDESPYQPLPSNANMRVSMRRTIRVGANSGTVLEDLGVTPDELHRITRDDLLGSNVDLLEAAGKLLKELPIRKLDATIGEGPQATLTLETTGLDRVDIYSENRPLGTVDVSDGITNLSIGPEETSIELRGFANDEIVAVRRELLV